MHATLILCVVATKPPKQIQGCLYRRLCGCVKDNRANHKMGKPFQILDFSL